MVSHLNLLNIILNTQCIYLVFTLFSYYIEEGAHFGFKYILVN